MTRSDRNRALRWPAALATAIVATVMLVPAAAAAGRRAVASQPVTFSVQNVNRSKLPCATDGATYQIRGHVVGPRSALVKSSRSIPRLKPGRSKPAVTLYLHGLGFGEWFWRFRAVPRYDYSAAQARAGHFSVVIDRLGYDTSARPNGNAICLGGQADIAHQIVQALRSGKYTVDGGRNLRYKRVALAGHSAGGQIAMIEAYSFSDVRALIDISFSFQNLPRAQVAFGPTRDSCLAGGQPAEPGGPSGYAYFGQPTPGDYRSIMFHSAKKAVLDAATQLRNPDPCGDIASIIPGLLQQQALVAKVRVPVLVICGTRDALFAALGCSMQADRFKRSSSRTVELVRGAGHALTLEAQAATFRRKISRWLSKRGF